MNLRDLAEADSKAILEDSVTGFGYPITVTSPDKVTASLTGFSNDISFSIDPDTGVAVSGRTASVALNISSLIDAGFSTLLTGIQDDKSKPWLVQFNDINGNPFTFKVIEGHPDRGLGIITCTLEIYRDQTKCQ
jgi:hypothetical protein